MRRRRKPWWPLIALVALGFAVPARAQTEEEEERQAVERRLASEREALKVLESSKRGLLSALNGAERLFRLGTARIQALEKAAAGLDAQRSAFARLEQAAQLAVDEQLARMEPRLLSMYRLRRREALTSLLSAKDFASMVRRDRDMRTLLEEDLTALAHVRSLLRFKERLVEQLASVELAAQKTLEALELEQKLAAERKAIFTLLLASVQQDAEQSSQLIRELQVEERQLAELVTKMKRSALAGFRSLKGRLPFPTAGMIEVGFGRVVNPRFNTVTVQKGLDLRAALGTAVVAIAPGTVVFSDWLKGYGNLLIVDHGDGFHSLMAHLAHATVEVGQEVTRGQKLAEVGDTASLKGAYLYFELRSRGEAIDPGPWLNEEVAP